MMSQMGAPMPSVREFRATLPSAARSLYYRDAIGNISTSHARFGLAATEVDLRPRYPLFGGWKVFLPFSGPCAHPVLDMKKQWCPANIMLRPPEQHCTLFSCSTLAATEVDLRPRCPLFGGWKVPLSLSGQCAHPVVHLEQWCPDLQYHAETLRAALYTVFVLQACCHGGGSAALIPPVRGLEGVALPFWAMRKVCAACRIVVPRSTAPYQGTLSSTVHICMLQADFYSIGSAAPDTPCFGAGNVQPYSELAEHSHGPCAEAAWHMQGLRLPPLLPGQLKQTCVPPAPVTAACEDRQPGCALLKLTLGTANAQMCITCASPNTQPQAAAPRRPTSGSATACPGGTTPILLRQ